MRPWIALSLLTLTCVLVFATGRWAYHDVERWRVAKAVAVARADSVRRVAAKAAADSARAQQDQYRTTIGILNAYGVKYDAVIHVGFATDSTPTRGVDSLVAPVLFLRGQHALNDSMGWR